MKIRMKVKPLHPLVMRPDTISPQEQAAKERGEGAGLSTGILLRPRIGNSGHQASKLLEPLTRRRRAEEGSAATSGERGVDGNEDSRYLQKERSLSTQMGFPSLEKK